MEAIDPATFDCSTLRERIESPEAHFAQLRGAGVAQRHAWVREMLAAQQEMVREVWQDGDELWRWQTTSRWGAYGLAVLRAGQVVRVWYQGRSL